MKIVLKNSFIYLLVAMVLDGCLKTNDYYQGFTGIAPIADIPLSHLSTDSITPYVVAVAASADATVDTLVAVHLSAKNHVGDVTFQLGLGDKDSAFTVYLKAHPEFELLPSNLYSFDSSVTIQNAGILNTADFSVKFKTGAVDADGNNLFLSHNYLLPIIIKDAGGYQVASNFRMIIMRPLAANEWAGNYQISGTMGGVNSYTGYDLGGSNTLSTVNGTTVAEFDVGDFFGGYTEYTFNPDGTISVSANAAQGQQNSYKAVVTESGYDKTTHNFHVTFSILGGEYVFPLTYTRQ